MGFNLLTNFWTLGAVLLYLACTITLFRNIEQSNGRPDSRFSLLLWFGIACHALALAGDMVSKDEINLNLAVAGSLVSWIVVVLFRLALLRQPVVALGFLVFPYTLITLIASWMWPGAPAPLANMGSTAIIHTLISIVAYGLLALGFCQAVLLLLQEWQLQNKRSGTIFHVLPPLQTMERILFQIIGIGFSGLTITLISGGLFAMELFGKALLFNHHIVLSIIAWISFGALLAGRLIYGWRGRVAALWTIGSFALLVLSYFGTRIVLELILGRA